jgi:hypothetical protein
MQDEIRFSYEEYVKQMYQNGFYLYSYSINLMSKEISSYGNRIFISPDTTEASVTYVFTGVRQKLAINSEPTLFKLYLEEENGAEFKDEDNIMMSIVKPKGIKNLFTRNYATWKYGISFDMGINIEKEYVMFQAQKNIEKFDIEIYNIDLFKKKNKKVESRNQKMIWLE